MTDTTLRLALVGNPNCGKSSLFNMLTGSRQKVGNYPGVTVERRAGRMVSEDGRTIDLIDLPGSYSLNPRSPDEEITRNVVMGMQEGELPPDVILCVIDATNLSFHLPLVLELKQLGRPILLALNMMDLAERDGIEIDPDVLSRELGMPVVPTVAVRKAGMRDLSAILSEDLEKIAGTGAPAAPARTSDFRELRREAKRIAAAATIAEGMEHRLTRVVDRIVLNRIAGLPILFGILFLMFQAVFAWAETPMDWIEAGAGWLATQVASLLADGFVKSLVVNGIIEGVGSVVVFLPQILILFAFILVLEATGYMARAAFIMDRLMAGVGLNGRAFIPLLSSFACAIPGIMAARTIDNPRDRLTTILVAPLMTCAARLPVYAVLIGAVIPAETVGFGVGLQGLTMFALYLIGIVSALVIAAVLKKTLTRGAAQPLLLELPNYQIPSPKNLLIGLWERAMVFLKRAGTIIMAATIILWALASFPKPPEDATEPPITYSAAAWLGGGLETVFSPIGFNWEISISLIPGMAAREVAVSSLGTIYALSVPEEELEDELSKTIAARWSLPTALAFLAWFIFAPQCLSTLAVTRRETNSWRWPIFMFGYLFALAYAAAGATFWIATALLSG